ncbi:NAD(P)H-dependent oxidoreductase [Candidatus Saccharibacteria bacterium]|nr:NAD(P)H-dependent oxidoreductase [Candidatus Saccharibacteria bacterium]
MKIAVLVGSLQEKSVNKMLARAMEAHAPEGVEFIYADLNLPLFNQDVEAAAFPAEATKLKELVELADGVLVVTPEYNRSFPGVLKNALDWASRPWGQNSFDGKPAGIVGASIAPTGTTQAQAQLRSVMVYLNTALLGQPELYVNAPASFDESGQPNEGTDEAIKNYVDTFIAHVQSATRS